MPPRPEYYKTARQRGGSCSRPKALPVDQHFVDTVARELVAHPELTAGNAEVFSDEAARRIASSSANICNGGSLHHSVLTASNEAEVMERDDNVYERINEIVSDLSGGGRPRRVSPSLAADVEALCALMAKTRAAGTTRGPETSAVELQ